MTLDFLFLISKIRTLFGEHFSNTLVNISSDDSYGDIMVSLGNKEEYYSSEFQELVSYININILWPANITNVIFVADEKSTYEPIISTRLIQNISDLSAQWKIQDADDYCVDLPCENYCYDSDYLKAA